MTHPVFRDLIELSSKPRSEIPEKIQRMSTPTLALMIKAVEDKPNYDPFNTWQFASIDRQIAMDEIHDEIQKTKPVSQRSGTARGTFGRSRLPRRSKR
jgi:hypothetical protein